MNGLKDDEDKKRNGIIKDDGDDKNDDGKINGKGSLEDQRYDHLKNLIGDRPTKKILNSSVLVIGSGGIGCELLKNLVCTGFGKITIVDLDTVDTSNLNRQFLFQKRHVKKPKAIVARETASAFNPHVSINALQANIMDPEFDQAYFKRFDLVMNALDNLAARRHVNKMCIITNVPLIESGTAGYTGQVQPIQRKMECYECHPKPLPKTFPVCTIRSTPSTPIHCIVWAKGYLFPQLFGPEDENEGADLDEALQNGESAKEIENLREEVKQMKEIRSRLNTPEMSKLLFTKVFEEDINRLLKMDDMWKHRRAPTPLSYDTLNSSNHADDQVNGVSTINPALLKDQQALSLKDSFKLFNSSLLALANRVAADPNKEPLSWDKDDDDALNFVTAAANLRANVFGIQSKTRFEVKEMAGNIIPAIATTNSAVSALIVFQAIQVLTRSIPQKQQQQQDQQPLLKFPIRSCRPWYNKTPERVILSGDIDPPNPTCEVCQVVYSTLKVKRTTKLREFIEKVLRGKIYEDDEGYEKVTIQEGDRLLFDVDFVENGERSFEEVGLIDDRLTKVLRVTDENEVYVPLIFTISKTLPEEDEEDIRVEGFPETIPKRPIELKTTIDDQTEQKEKGSGNDSDIEVQDFISIEGSKDDKRSSLSNNNNNNKKKKKKRDREIRKDLEGDEEDFDEKICERGEGSLEGMDDEGLKDYRPSKKVKINHKNKNDDDDDDEVLEVVVGGCDYDSAIVID